MDAYLWQKWLEPLTGMETLKLRPTQELGVSYDNIL